MKIARKFYVSHPKIQDPHDTWAKATLAAAVKHAEELLERNTHQDVQYIVKIVRVVRRKKTPVVVERVE